MASCRRKKHLTVFTVARRMHMDAQRVIDFEHNEGTMTKGLLDSFINMYGMSRGICNSLILREVADKHPEVVRIIKNESTDV